jgi:hypothetical protein
MVHTLFLGEVINYARSSLKPTNFWNKTLKPFSKIRPSNFDGDNLQLVLIFRRPEGQKVPAPMEDLSLHKPFDLIFAFEIGKILSVPTEIIWKQNDHSTWMEPIYPNHVMLNVRYILFTSINSDVIMHKTMTSSTLLTSSS